MCPSQATQTTLSVSASESASVATRTPIWTIGHSTRAFDEFVSLLRENGIEFLADVRRFPMSRRVPWASKVTLPATLAPHAIGYDHFEDLGGYRKPLPDSENSGWRNSGFRGYADHMASEAFGHALDELLAIASAACTAIMCAEAVPWKCHRSLLSDSLMARQARVIHILGPGQTQDHRLTSFARNLDGRVTYPASGEKVFKR